MKIAVYSISSGKVVNSIVENLFKLQIKYNLQFYIEDSFSKKINSKYQSNFKTFSSHKQLDKTIDLMITIGGDGTLLRSVSYVRNLGIPVIGINTGRLGFLATLSLSELSTKLEKILKKEFNTEKRTLLKVQFKGIGNSSDFKYALNEISVTRKNTTSLIKIKTSLDGKYLNSYWADGLIISTPTGSTGYSLSCGGPIMYPQSKAFVLTPIAPHNLNARPIIIPEDLTVELSVSGREKYHLLSLDSEIISIKNGTIIKIKKADFKINIAHFHHDNFYQTIRNKLMWGEDKRNP
nr:NAD kinase [uncultured bacterium]